MHATLAAETAHSDLPGSQGSKWSVSSTHMMQHTQRTRELISLAAFCFSNLVHQPGIVFTNAVPVCLVSFVLMCL
jgi:hypothetical protein